MTPEEMQGRFKQYALRVIRLVGKLPKGPAAEVIGRQLVKAATSAAANYRAACIARSRADFIHKMSIVEEETDESTFWVDLAADAKIIRRPLIDGLLQEGQELLAIVVSSKKTAKARQAKAQSARRKQTQ
ncbi:hypothetical protein LCGC14_1313000 [marine sediment metagenome]|uniref:Four helix bundle protein n=1 Tax=marine sediment metagenome TaxID=412755 RepID=A0A0F9KMA5_9ZZZZ